MRLFSRRQCAPYAERHGTPSGSRGRSSSNRQPARATGGLPPDRRRRLAVSVTRAYTPREYADNRHDSSFRHPSAQRRRSLDRDPAADRGHELRLVREPDRALPAQDPGRGRGQRQPGDGGRHHPLPAGGRRAGRAGPRDRSGRLRGPPPAGRGRRQPDGPGRRGRRRGRRASPRSSVRWAFRRPSRLASPR